MNVDAGFFGGAVQILHQPRPSARDFQRHAAEKATPAVDHGGLAAVIRHKLHALGAQPDHGVQAAGDQAFGELRVGLELRQAKQVVKKLVGGVGAEVAFGHFGVGQVNDFFELFDGGKRKAHHAAGKAAVAAAFVRGGGFKNGHFGALLSGCQRCT